jgi:8-oxo-dGTP diphosphatase
MARKAIQAAGGIVVRGGGARPLIAVVQRSKDERWVLPRGKLKRDESPRAGARREVVEETGHRVNVHEYLGAITYNVRGQPKVVQFWRMKAEANPSRDITKDIAAVDWLPLAAAERRLSFVLEKLFLRNVGRRALKRGRRNARRRLPRRSKSTRRSSGRAVGRAAKRSSRKRRGPARKPHHPPAPRHVAQITPARSPVAGHVERSSMLQRVLGRLRG